jgi:hypothetical protein
MRLMLAATLAFTLAAPLATLKFDAPSDWVSKAPSSSMRVAEWSLPKAAADAEDAVLTLYFFGASQGGNVQANLDRWIGQMAQPDDRQSKDVAKTSSLTSHGLKITLVDVTGTYVAEVTPGSTEHFNKPGFRQCAAVVETPGGPYFVKLVGPVKTVDKWNDSFEAFLKTLRYE